MSSSLVRLSPAYDLLSTLPYGDQALALPIEGRHKNLVRSHFSTFGKRIGLPAPAVAGMLDRLVPGVAHACRDLAPIGLGNRRTQQLEREVARRSAALGSG